uniref:Ovule protein n=1 Tax=Angiostrongylus cantonensis TaxID=6313 RepID=A0A0K0D7U7_ANGCA
LKLMLPRILQVSDSTPKPKRETVVNCEFAEDSVPPSSCCCGKIKVQVGNQCYSKDFKSEKMALVVRLILSIVRTTHQFFKY